MSAVRSTPRASARGVALRAKRVNLEHDRKLRAHRLGELRCRVARIWPKTWPTVRVTRQTSVRALHALLLLAERGTKPKYVQDVRRLPGVGNKTTWELMRLLKLVWK